MTGRTGYTAPTNASDFAPSEDMAAIYAYFDALIGESEPTAADLPADGEWQGHTIYTDGALRVWDESTGAAGWNSVTALVLGIGAAVGPTIVAGTPSWTDVASVTATSHGGTCDVDWASLGYNSASGATRTVSYRVVVDGTPIGVGGATVMSVDLTTSTGNGQLQAFMATSKPAAGSHTWKLQMNCSVGSACGFKNSYLKVTER